MERFYKMILLFGLIITVALSVAFIALGLLLILCPESVLKLLLYVLAGSCILIGAIGIFSLFRVAILGMKR